MSFKKLTVIVSLVKAYRDHGSDGKEFADAYSQALFFLRKEPVVDDSAWVPAWIAIVRHRFEALTAVDVRKFWEAIQFSTLKAERYDAASMVKNQCELVADRLLEAVRASTEITLSKNLAELTGGENYAGLEVDEGNANVMTIPTPT